MKDEEEEQYCLIDGTGERRSNTSLLLPLEGQLACGRRNSTTDSKRVCANVERGHHPKYHGDAMETDKNTHREGKGVRERKDEEPGQVRTAEMLDC